MSHDIPNHLSDDGSSHVPSFIPMHLANKPDTEVLRVNDDPKKYLYFVRNPADVRLSLERVLDAYEDRLQGLSSSQFAIVLRVGIKAATYGAVKPIKQLKNEQKMYFRQAKESRRAEFYLEVDETNWEPLSEEQQEKLLYNQLCRIVSIPEENKFIIQKPDIQLYLSMVRTYGEDLPEVVGMQRALEVNKKEASNA